MVPVVSVKCVLKNCIDKPFKLQELQLFTHCAISAEDGGGSRFGKWLSVEGEI